MTKCPPGASSPLWLCSQGYQVQAAWCTVPGKEVIGLPGQLTKGQVLRGTKTASPPQLAGPALVSESQTACICPLPWEGSQLSPVWFGGNATRLGSSILDGG